MVIHQIKSWSIFVSKSTKKDKKVKLQNGTYKNLPHQYIKEYKIGQRGRKYDQNVRASFVLIVGGGRSTINVERINSQLSLSCEIASVDLEGGQLTPQRHSVCSTGWPLVIKKIATA